MTRYTGQTPIHEILLANPLATQVFARHGLGCPSCMAAGFESLSEVSFMHDVSLELLLDDLNGLDATTAESEDFDSEEDL